MSGYIGPLPVPQGIQRKQSFTATASQTTFNTNGYTDGNFINVYLNGVRLINGTDYTATNGSDIVLTTGASASDVLDFETFDTFELVNQTFDNVTLKNPTHEDTDGGRESAVSFKGEQSGGEISTLAQIQASHDGTSDDQKGDLIFKTNDGSDNDAPTERMRVDSAGNVGIAVNDPDAVLDISGGTNKLGILRVVQRTSGAAAYGLDIGLDPTLGDPVFSKIENDVVSESFRIRRTNGALISSGGITLGTAGAAYAAANTLEDYEEGSFSPTFNDASGATLTITYSYQLGHYIKIGTLCWVSMAVGWSAFSGGGTGNFRLGNLPFTPDGSGTCRAVGSLPYTQAFTGLTNAYGLEPHTNLAGAAAGTYFYFKDGNGNLTDYVDTNNILNSGAIQCMLVYRTD